MVVVFREETWKKVMNDVQSVANFRSLHVIDVVKFVWCSGASLFILLEGHLPDLENVVFGARGHHKPLIQVPRDVLDLGRVASVNENKLGWTITFLLLGLLCATFSQVPNHDPPIGAR